MKRLFILSFLYLINSIDILAQAKILFDATKAESAANADWIIDADMYNVGFGGGNPSIGGSGTEANPARFPTPAQSNITTNTSEDYWKGGLSAYAVECVKKGYQVETLPIGAKLTYNDATNPQDLKNYKVFVVCEPNILFSASEKTALKNFVENGGGLMLVSGHDGSDRNFDGFDSPRIWNDFFTTFNNSFGIAADLVDFSETTSNIPITSNDPLLNGSYGNVTQARFSGATTFTLDPTKNPTVKGVVYRKGSSFGNTNVCVAYAQFGQGRVVVVGDSSPFDDGTGDLNDNLYFGWTEVNGNHRKLIMNATVWLAAISTPAISLQTTQTNVSCYGAKTGVASVSATGGTGVFSYLWSNNATTSSISNLAAGIYLVTVTSGSQKSFASITITEPSEFFAIASANSINCKTPTSLINVSVVGGAQPYAYKWSNNTTSAQLTIAKGGTYSVTITDNKGCLTNTSYNIAEDKIAPVIETKTSNPSCLLFCGEVTKPTGANFTYLWTGGATTQKNCSTNNMMNVSVTNTQNGCFSESKILIIAPSPILVTLLSSTKAVGAQKNGSATIDIKGGISPYKYEWTDNQNKIVATTQTLNNVGSGIYICKITDAQGCFSSFTVIISNTVATKDVTQSDAFDIFPNPTNGEFVLRLRENTEAKVTLLGIEGNIIFTKLVAQESSFDITSLPNQLYLLKIEMEKKIFYTKIIKN